MGDQRLHACAGLGRGLVGFRVFVVLERRVRFPLLDLDLFSIRSFSVMIIAGVIGNVAMTVTIFAAVVFLQDVEHFSPMQAGLAFVAFSGGVTLAAQSPAALMSSIGEVLIAAGVLSVLFVPIVTWLARMRARELATE